MADHHMQKLADILVHYCTAVKSGDWVRIIGDVGALPLVTEVTRLVVRAGGNPSIQLTADGLDEAILSEASTEQLEWIPPTDVIFNDQIDVSIRIAATSNTRALTGIDPAKQRIMQNARRDLRQRSLQRAAEGQFRWVLTQFPCPAYAQEADMSLRAYEDFV